MGNAYSHENEQAEQVFEVINDAASNAPSEPLTRVADQLPKDTLKGVEEQETRLKTNRANYLKYITEQKEYEAMDFDLQKHTLGLIAMEFAVSLVALSLVEPVDPTTWPSSFYIFGISLGPRVLLPMLLALFLSARILFVHPDSATIDRLLHMQRVAWNVFLIAFCRLNPTAPPVKLSEFFIWFSGTRYFVLVFFKFVFAMLYVLDMFAVTRGRLLEQRDMAELAAGYDSFASSVPASESEDALVEEESINDDFEVAVDADVITAAAGEDFDDEENAPDSTEIPEPTFTVTLPSACCAGLVLGLSASDLSITFVEMTVPRSAAEAKVRAGDEVVSINGATVYGMTYEQVDAMLFKACKESALISLELRHNKFLAELIATGEQ